MTGSTGGAWLLVARREVMVRVTDRSFLVGTLVTIAIIAGLIAVQAVFASRTETYTVAVPPAATAMAETVRDRATGIDEDVVVELLAVTGDAAGRAAVADESADAMLHQEGGTWVLTTKSQPEEALQAVVTGIVRDATVQANAAAAGVSVADLQRGSELRPELLEGDAQRAQLVTIVGFAFGFLFYMASILFGVALANSVLEEKQSRVVEIIASSIPVRHLLAGKVVGNTVLAVVQLALYVAVGLVGLAFTEFSGLVTGISGPVVWFVAFFLAGFVALACLWAVAGSLASRSEDLQSTTTPLTMLIMVVFFGGLLLEGTARTVGSFVPPLSAVLMPIRLLEHAAAWYEVVLALVLLLACAALTVLVGERIYRRSLLQSGGRVTLRQAWRAED
ncbi:MAG: ABC transporter permease [Actinomycetales bacterium]|nr:ABC transporter permease [Actinomycetales bacterium]